MLKLPFLISLSCISLRAFASDPVTDTWAGIQSPCKAYYGQGSTNSGSSQICVDLCIHSASKVSGRQVTKTERCFEFPSDSAARSHKDTLDAVLMNLNTSAAREEAIRLARTGSSADSVVSSIKQRFGTESCANATKVLTGADYALRKARESFQLTHAKLTCDVNAQGVQQALGNATR